MSNSDPFIDPTTISRRRFLQHMGIAGAATFFGLYNTASFAEMLAATPRLTEGPFYPNKLPLDTDNDLLVINDSITPALGEVTHLSGRILTQAGTPVRNALIEIWQVDNSGCYIHTGDTNNRAKQDKNFQGYGRFITDSSGAYYFRTIKPVSYPGRTPHIHVGVSVNGKRVLTTQILVKGEAQNERDGVFKSIRDAKLRDTLVADFKPLKDSKIGELTAEFDIILGVTVPDKVEKIKGGIGPSEWGKRR
ncbi:hypothetical protein Rhal01_01276 [Rubritalea halochordaticola]|uniref:Intradiol ring-cleavage dioxygenases domain-containing protein n=1 Tax=Rubritalea halochordaticola TaxID=714537 RepID=A0ABP9UXB3_9BACT